MTQEKTRRGREETGGSLNTGHHIKERIEWCSTNKAEGTKKIKRKKKKKKKQTRPRHPPQIHHHKSWIKKKKR